MSPSLAEKLRPGTSIRTRLTLSHLAVIVVAMGLSGLLLLSLLDRYFMQAMEQSLITQAQITAQALIPGATTLDSLPEGEAPASSTLLQQQLRNYRVQTENVVSPEEGVPASDWDLGHLANASLELSAQLETRIRVLDVDGVVLIDSAQDTQGTNLQGDPLVAQALKGQYVSYTDEVRRGTTAAMHIALPMMIEGRLVGVVYLSQSLQDVVAVLREVRARWWLSMVVALVLSGAAGLILSGAIARPVRQLTAAAGAVAQGQLNLQVPVRTRDELGRLSRTFNDMTARLKAARQMQTDFVANVSHELRTPLTSVKGLVETLQDGAVDDLQVRDQFLGTIEHETDRLIGLVNDLLLLSRVDSEALRLRLEPVDLDQLVQAAVDQFTPLVEAKLLSVRVEADPALPHVSADPDRITQVVLNLLDNAVKYSEPGGTVAVVIGVGDHGMAQVQVRDEGIGIAPEDLPHIGERFYRADKARSRTYGGSGLGLAIARALVEVHGGQLWIDSSAGQGTTVTFYLPVS